MRYIGVDLGQKRVGFAVSGEAGLLAVPVRTVNVRSLAEARDAVAKIMAEFNAGLAVVGHARDMDGRAGAKAAECQQFAAMLKEAGIAVELWDERLTSAEAERYLSEAGIGPRQRKGKIDALAAQRILESFLSAKQKQG